jgi:hypothetical protein
MHGPEEWVEGYYSLEESERGMTMRALRNHGTEVAYWYRALTLYRRGMTGSFEYPGEKNGPADAVAAWGLQMQLLGLGVGHAKAGLDMLLMGYYSLAYAAVRHMLESFFQCVYLALFPEESPLWYGKPGALAAAEAARKTGKKQLEHEPPGCWCMSKRLGGAMPSVEPFYETVYRAWKLMCKGAHPSAEGTTQTHTADQGRFDFGATYNEELFLVGFDNGIFAVILLMRVLSGVRPQAAEWERALDSLDSRVSAWRAALAETRQAN